MRITTACDGGGEQARPCEVHIAGRTLSRDGTDAVMTRASIGTRGGAGAANAVVNERPFACRFASCSARTRVGRALDRLCIDGDRLVHPLVERLLVDPCVSTIAPCGPP